ncbi:PrsW family intramembrane metalloprotease [Treponema sp. TIM-1]|uniref:PrsW family glutamic-type intramembrane protease n=1 Tax=Treponema sp. TIM-1 TaxID=2898417 RepID=UPI003981553F
MDEWDLLLLVIITLLPLISVYLWFRISKFPVGLVWFLLALLGGAAALLVAVLIQSLFPKFGGNFTEGFFFNLFIKIALTEELGRFMVLLLLFRLRSCFYRSMPTESPPLSQGLVTGLLTGLGFAAVETASYGPANLGIALFRVFTTAPLHGACGARNGAAAILCTRHPLRASLRFFSAVIIHGMYNFMVIRTGFYSVFAVLIALTALASSIQEIRSIPITPFRLE